MSYFDLDFAFLFNFLFEISEQTVDRFFKYQTKIKTLFLVIQWLWWVRLKKEPKVPQFRGTGPLNTSSVEFSSSWCQWSIENNTCICRWPTGWGCCSEMALLSAAYNESLAMQYACHYIPHGHVPVSRGMPHIYSNCLSLLTLKTTCLFHTLKHGIFGSLSAHSFCTVL